MYRFGLIGYPIAHSLSPWIHKEFMKRTHIDGEYEIYEINPEGSFSEKINAFRQKELHGFNITVPYKQKIIPFLDEVDHTAKAIGAVNTVRNKNGKWIGYNTDGIGYVRSLKSKYPRLFSKADRRALILGAGGAARGIYAALQDAGFTTIDIANRTKEKALDIIRLYQVQSQVMPLESVEKQIDQYDVVIQTTSVGMKPYADKSIIEIKNTKPNDTIVSDIIYQPIETNLLTQAKCYGFSLHFGHTMLLYQAQYAYEIWTGIKPPMERMDQELQLILEGR
ncbi:MAG: shikimate dehydrogenase [Bacillota bacterium]|uniref:Shikimate dehydrogenase (NADP(+)) n=1 Tax=Virgibacillus salarius TaxID=447199 RepID=A0A941ICE3_9BACI|nr:MULTISPECIES: shikimate dehydrogenase [Bacillaceae]MBR7797312.1 shikimate dehydrogenase [Virgibacillus salarius]MCC2250232.1 shikimate dehydrogenase [Virgibacillus sp. AGTR]NAZ10022.1 shikimate dehydrogenase [Agaribacter marinus]QRZ17482.1 shikimate dehydrogenase [Virgibacillus sp. AGTR]